MSDWRVDTRVIEAKYGLHKPNQQIWSVTPVWQPGAKGKQLVTMDNAGAAADIVHGLIWIYEAQTMPEHRQAVAILEEQLLWDAPDIRLTTEDQLRLALFLFKHIARPKLVPIVAAASEPSPGATLIGLDAVYVLRHNKPWFVPITWLLPDESASNVQMKIGVTLCGKVELMVARFTNLPPFPLLGWQRGVVSMLMGAVPQALEGLLSDAAADGGDSSRENARTSELRS